VCLRKLNKEVFGNILEEKKKIEKEMEVIQKKEFKVSSPLTSLLREAEIRDDLVKRER
jgi:hypothetical protein